MKQKITLIAAFIFAVSLSVNAQKKVPHLILRGGVNFANISIDDNGNVDDNKTLTSFQVGFLGDLPITKFLALQPGVIFTGKGSKTQAGSPSDANYFKATTNPYYIEIPLSLVFKTPTGPVKFFAGAGPYIAIGVAGNNKVTGKFGGVQFDNKEKIEWSNDDPGTLNYEEGAGYGLLKRFDYGLNGTVGLDIHGCLISANYGLGLAKIQSGTNDQKGASDKHRVFSVTLGFEL